MEVHDVVQKLVGEIEPVGETYADDARFENLKAMCKLVDCLLGDIDRVVTNKRRVEFSMQRAGKYADDFFTRLGISD